MLTAMLDGVVISPDHAAIHIDDRGLLYGDGLFETMLLRNGVIRFFDDHVQRLHHSCERLKISPPVLDCLQGELRQLLQNHRDGVIKLIVTRGRGGRGYRATRNHPTRLWQLFPPIGVTDDSITMRWCETRWSRNELLAGMKHLNRLEQVLAQSEWNDMAIAEGLMLDTEGELISGTMSNVFMVIDGNLVTPDVLYCGVQGVMRKNVLRMAKQMGMVVEERPVHPEELAVASEVFVSNAVRGIQSVAALLPSILDGIEWKTGAVTTGLIHLLNQQG